MTFRELMDAAGIDVATLAFEVTRRKRTISPHEKPVSQAMIYKWRSGTEPSGLNLISCAQVLNVEPITVIEAVRSSRNPVVSNG